MSARIITIKNNIPGYLAALPGKIDDALAQGGGLMAGTASGLVRVDTGELQATIETYPDGAHSQVVAAGTDHALINEMGTRYMPAQPFMLPAFEAHVQDTIDLIGQAVEEAAR